MNAERTNPGTHPGTHPGLAEDPNRKALGVWCPRCQSRKVVEGQLGESTRFYPSRPLFKALKGRPVEFAKPNAYACARCGLAWSEVEPEGLQKNIQKYGLSMHSSGVMRIVDGETTGALRVDPPPTSTEAR